MSVKDCEITNDFIEKQVQRDIEAFDIETQSALGQMIGYPSKKAQKTVSYQIAHEEAQSRPNLSKIKRLKQRLNDEIKKYQAHDELFEMLREYINESGHLIQYDMSPAEAVNDWKIYLKSRGWADISPLMFTQSPRAIYSVTKRIKAVMNKRDKILKKGKLSNREIAVFKPEVIGITADRFGIVTKVIKKALEISSSEINSYADYATRFGEATAKFKNLLEDIAVKTLGKVHVFNLNNSSLWGLEGFNIKDTDEPVLIIGEDVIDNAFDAYLVKRWDESLGVWKKHDPETDFVRIEDLKESREEVQKALIRQYTDHFFNEVLDGQTRYVNLGVIPPQFFTNKKGVTEENPEYSEFRKMWRGDKGSIGLLLEEMAQDREFNAENDGSRATPNLHNATSKNAEYRYTLLYNKSESIKQGKKIYSAFIVSKKVKGGKWESMFSKESEGHAIEDWEGITDMNGRQMADGFFRSTEEYNYGRMRYPDGKDFIPDSSRKAYRNFSMIENQPQEEVFSGKPFEPGVDYSTFWETLSEYESVYKEVGKDINDFNIRNEKRVGNFRTRVEKMLFKLGKTPEEVSEYMNKILSIGGIGSKVFKKDVKDPFGNILHTELRTPNSYFKLKSHNFFPHMFEESDLFEMLNDEIDSAEDAKLEVETKHGEDSDQFKDLEASIEYLKVIRDRITGDISENDVDAISRLVEGEANVHFKHRTSWTNATKKKTDNGVHHEYLKKIYSNLHRTSLTSDVMEATEKLIRSEGNIIPEGTMDYLLNRVKMAVGDSDTRSMSFITGREGGYDNVANNLNKLPKSVRGGLKFTTSSAEKLVKWITSIPTQRFLGTSTAIGNLTQITNQIIANGFTTFWEVQHIMGNKDESAKWDRIIEKTGVLNLMTMFQDIMLQGGEAEWNQSGFLAMGALGPIPGRNMVEWYRLLSKGRDSFIKNKDADLEAFLMKIEYRNKGLIGEKIKDLKKLAKKKRELNQKRDDILLKKKGELFDILTYKPEDVPEGVNKLDKDIGNMESLMKKFIGDISDMKIKQMSSWKLSWHFNLGKGMKDFLTFSGTETMLRKFTAIMALKDASKRGILPSELTEVNGSIWASPKAVQIARDAVYQSQFGMTPAYVGEGFNGLGRAIWQYKIYPTSQMEHDFNVLRRMWEGDKNPGESLNRIRKALFVGENSAIRRAYKRKGYTPKDTSLDHEALAVTRLIFSRFLASAIASVISVVPIIGMIARRSGSTYFSMMRSAENPAVGIMMRVAVWTSLIMMGADDDDRDSYLEDILQQFSFLFLPIWIGMVGQDIFRAYEFFDND